MTSPCRMGRRAWRGIGSRVSYAPPKPTHQPRIEVYDDHVWVGGADVPLTEAEAREALRRGTVTIHDTKATVHDVYCDNCRRPHTEVVGLPCIVDAELLRGGPIGIRKKRRRSGDLPAGEPPVEEEDDGIPDPPSS